MVGSGPPAQVPPGQDLVRLFGWLILAVSLVVQAWGLYAPSPPGPDGPPGLDKIGHLLSFGIPAALAALLGARWLLWLLLLHALVSEPLQQALAPTRQLDGWDTVADLVGIAVGVLVVRAVQRRRRHDGGMTPNGEEGR